MKSEEKLITELTGGQLCRMLRISLSKDNDTAARRSMSRREVEFEKLKMENNNVRRDARVAIRERHSMATELANLQLEMAVLATAHSELKWKLEKRGERQ